MTNNPTAVPAKKHGCNLPWRRGGYGSTGQPDGTVIVCSVCDTAWYSGPCYESFGPVDKWYKIRWYHRKYRRIADQLRTANMPSPSDPIDSAVALHCQHTGPIDPTAPEGCRDCATIAEEVRTALHRNKYRRIRDDQVVIPRDSLRSAATIVGNHAEMLEHLVMDTPEDQALNDKVIAVAEASARALRTLAEKTT